MLPLPAIASQTFLVTGSSWGTPANPVEAAPGSQGVPLVVSLEYFGTTTASNVKGTLSLGSGFTDSSGNPTAVAYTTGIPANSIFQLTFSLNIGPSVPTGTYPLALNMVWNTSSARNSAETDTVTSSLNGQVKLNFAPTQQALVAGSLNNLTFSLSNQGSGPASQVSVTVTPPPSVSVTGQISTIGSLPASSFSSQTLQVYVPASAAGLALTFTLTASYRDAYSNPRTVTQTLGFYVLTLQTGSLSLSSTVTSLSVGQTNSVSLFVQSNWSSPIKSLFVVVAAQAPLSIVGSDGSFSISGLGASQTASIAISLYVSPTSAYSWPITVTSTYVSVDGSLHSDQKTLSFLLNSQFGLSPLSLSVQPSTLTSGKVNNLTLAISNTGSYQITRLTATFSFPGAQINWLQPDIFQAQAIPPGQNATVQARVYAPPLSTTTTTLQVSLKYYDNNNVLNTETRSLGLLARGAVQLTLVDLSTVPQNPTPGQIFSATATVTNIGTITASAVTATADVPAGLRIFGSKSVFVGDMQVNTPTTFTISFFVENETRPGNYQIPVQLTYLDNLRSQLSAGLTVAVQVTGNPTSAPATQRQRTLGFPFTLEVLAAIVAVITLIVGYYIGKRSSRK